MPVPVPNDGVLLKKNLCCRVAFATARYGFARSAPNVQKQQTRLRGQVPNTKVMDFRLEWLVYYLYVSGSSLPSALFPISLIL